SRSFYVGDHVTENDVKAAYKDGALHLSFPKEAPKEVPETKYIAIE
ncbi:MAG: Hsp20 family protein, partial [Firmicutes bacterium]|nr:Hsp20 family protein [Bacillota bacterium]MCI6712028.1 Hsp20 family protein [Bacillota bacterium]MDD7734730.1 Hsp20 family protein [Bacillota bacterium]MDD7734773.1 Hsp20 family protein [Bacillota bacterium]